MSGLVAVGMCGTQTPWGWRRDRQRAVLSHRCTDVNHNLGYSFWNGPYLPNPYSSFATQELVVV